MVVLGSLLGRLQDHRGHGGSWREAQAVGWAAINTPGRISLRPGSGLEKLSVEREVKIRDLRVASRSPSETRRERRP